MSLDTTLANHTQAYGADDSETPSLMSLADDGVVFERAYAVAPVTLPSHISLFTGLYPTAHGMYNNGIALPDDRAPWLAEILREAGLRTGAFVSAAVLERRYGLARGFDDYDDNLAGSGPRGESHRLGIAVFAKGKDRSPRVRSGAEAPRSLPLNGLIS